MANTIEWTEITAIQYALWESGKTQRDLAQRLGWHEVRLSKILSGKQRLLVDDLREIAVAQDKDLSWYLAPPETTVRGLWAYRWFPRPIDVNSEITKLVTLGIEHPEWEAA